MCSFGILIGERMSRGNAAKVEIGRYNVVGITEMWLQGDQGWDLNIQGYVSYRKDRQMGKGGGLHC